VIGDTDSINTALDRKIDHPSTGGRGGRVSQGLISPQFFAVLGVKNVEVPVARANVDLAVVFKR
jgi:hypothetical protein